MAEEYDWFLAEVVAAGGIMNTDYATINYITLEELYALEDVGIISRCIGGGEDFILIR